MNYPENPTGYDGYGAPIYDPTPGGPDGPPVQTKNGPWYYVGVVVGTILLALIAAIIIGALGLAAVSIWQSLIGSVS